MRKVELTEAEAAAVSAIIMRDIDRAADAENFYRARIQAAKSQGEDPAHCDSASLDYWKERLHMLRQIKSKLGREETEGDDAQD